MQKTAYDMRISDWSSGVCSSDLIVAHRAALAVLPDPAQVLRLRVRGQRRQLPARTEAVIAHVQRARRQRADDARMRPRRVELAVVAVDHRHHVQRLGAGAAAVEATLQFQPWPRTPGTQISVPAGAALLLLPLQYRPL